MEKKYLGIVMDTGKPEDMITGETERERAEERKSGL